MKLAHALVAAHLIFLTAAAQPLVAEPSGASREVEAVIESMWEQYGFPGATVAFVDATGRVESVAIGFSDVEAATPMTPDSRMLAASIGKTIWGALVLALESEDKLRRTDLVSSHLGHLPWYSRVPNADQITIGQLLTHSAGLPDHVHMEGAAAALIGQGKDVPPDPAELVSFVLDEAPLFEAGTDWAYTDTGYVLLGMAIEQATGRGVFELAQERFLMPLGMTATGPSGSAHIESLAVGYTVEGNPFGLPPRTMDDDGSLVWNPAVEWTGGGFVSTSADLALWGHALFTGKAMPGQYLGRLLDGVAVHPDAPDVSYGSGVAIYEDTPFGPVFGHGGWIPGYVSSLRHYAEHDLTIAFQINTDVGVVDDSTDLVSAVEAALAKALTDQPQAQ